MGASNIASAALDPGVAHAGLITGNIGNTPLVRLGRLFPKHDAHAKLELLNPTQSMKDRSAFHILSAAEREGTLLPGAPIVESSSGNFGLSVALYGNIKNHPVICVVDPRLMPYYRRMYAILGVEMRVVDEMEQGSYQLGRIRKVKELSARIPGAYVPNQYDNPRNAEAHYLFTGGEILRQVGERSIDYLFVGISTGGTLTGIARRIRERHPECEIVAVDAQGSPLFDPCPRPRLMTGLGSNYVSRNLDKDLISTVVLVSDLEATAMARVLTRQEGIFAGVSAGAVVAAIRKMSDRIPPGKTIVTLLPDSGNRYIETFYNDRWVRRHLGVDINRLGRERGGLENLVTPIPPSEGRPPRDSGLFMARGNT
ncbi:MAG TPA: pyridoxal-phosphate dependent enzyme [Polyangiaceae bacterium]|nr:pyridoxal-phosphate dependent enzyme [Polyangiaceae bacterium]